MTQSTSANMGGESTVVTYDETHDRGGNVRAGWQQVLDFCAQFDNAQIARRQSEISKLLRTNGIAYNAVSSERIDDRPWKLDLLPFVIEENDWSTLSAGLVQRAHLKKLLLRDLYGEQRVIREGILPPAVVFSHQGFLRVAEQLPGTDELPFFGIDVSRSPSGDWHVVDDICQVPGGLGYALENRIVLSRVLPKLFRQSSVTRLVSYFRSLQNHLTLSEASDERCVILAYGSTHPYYFEYAYLAKYLGYTLVEMSDLTVRDERVYLKTVAGLQRVDVILRFVRDHDSDPLAVTNSQSVGVPGLLHAIMANNVKVINPLGVGVIENPALNAYLQPLCRYFLGEDVKLLSTPTYWLGDDEHRAQTQSRQMELLYRNVNTVGSLTDPAVLSADEQQALFAKINSEPEAYVAQERLDRSNAPCLLDEEHLRRQITLRSYLIDNKGDYQIMNGGLCVLDNVANGGRPSHDLFEGSKDVWVLSSKNVAEDTMIQAASESLHTIIEGELPSRVADNLFWLGRYTEKTESIIRVLSILLNEKLDDESQSYDVTSDDVTEISLSLTVLLKTLAEITDTSTDIASESDEPPLRILFREIFEMLLDDDRYGTLANTIASVRNTSNQLRDRLSPELMRVLNDLDDSQKKIHLMLDGIDHQELRTQSYVLPTLIELLETLLVSLAAFTGLVHENLTHGDNWRFIMMGKRIERVDQSIGVIKVFMLHDRENTQLMEILLRLFDSTITYRTRYRSRLNNILVTHLLLLDEVNPRSIAFQFRYLDECVRNLPGRRHSNYQEPLLRLSTAGLSRVRLAETETLLSRKSASDRQTMNSFLEVLGRIPGELSTELTAAYFTHSELPRSLIQNSTLDAQADTNQSTSADKSDASAGGNSSGGSS